MVASGRAEGVYVGWGVDGRPLVPDMPIVGYIEGDGTGPDIWAATRPVLDAAVEAAYGGRRRILWKELLAGEKAQRQFGQDRPLPEETLEEIRRCGIVLKGPLTTPVGGGFRSVNVTLRQRLDLYACVRPVRYIPGVPSPVRHPERVRCVIFRENTEDVYAGIEWPAGSEEAQEVIAFVNERLRRKGGAPLPMDCALGIKPMTKRNSQRLVAKAIAYALQHGYGSVTLVHKGNIMKYTEGAFKEWGYALAREAFGDKVVFEEELGGEGPGPQGKLVMKDRIADAMFQQLLLRPEEFGVIATPNLNGDYLSDAVAAQVGGLGMAPGYNEGERCVVFEATHGSAPKYAGRDKVNPTSLILSGVEMLRFLGWEEAGAAVIQALTETIGGGLVTYDLARQMDESRVVTCSGFGEAIRRALRGQERG